MAFGTAVALRHLRGLLPPRNHSYPGAPFGSGRAGGRLGSHFGDHWMGRIHPASGSLRQPPDGVLVRLPRLPDALLQDLHLTLDQFQPGPPVRRRGFHDRCLHVRLPPPRRQWLSPAGQGGELPSWELEFALSGGVGDDHRQHALVYVDSRYFVYSIHGLLCRRTSVEHAVKWLTTVSCYQRSQKRRRTLIGSNAGSGSDRPTDSNSPLRRRPRPGVHHFIARDHKQSREDGFAASHPRRVAPSPCRPLAVSPPLASTPFVDAGERSSPSAVE